MTRTPEHACKWVISLPIDCHLTPLPLGYVEMKVIEFKWKPELRFGDTPSALCSGSWILWAHLVAGCAFLKGRKINILWNIRLNGWDSRGLIKCMPGTTFFSGFPGNGFCVCKWTTVCKAWKSPVRLMGYIKYPNFYYNLCRLLGYPFGLKYSPHRTFPQGLKPPSHHLLRVYYLSAALRNSSDWVRTDSDINVWGAVLCPLLCKQFQLSRAGGNSHSKSALAA